ncbi:MAG: inorganic diphosphatase [Thermaerobacter sp.]|nr:inorganic diphosphatase [Thermaerobacter sp.]
MDVEVIVEIPRGSQNKYEFDHETGRIRLDRVLYSPFHYPAEYGFVEHTLGEDGDPIDVLVLATHPTFPGCTIRTRLVGMLEMTDDKGPDSKLLGVAADDPRYDHVRTLSDVQPHVLKEIAHFFETYKELEGKETIIGGWKDTAAAVQELDASLIRYQG